MRPSYRRERDVPTDDDRAEGEEEVVDEPALEEVAVERGATLDQRDLDAKLLPHVAQHLRHDVAGEHHQGASGRLDSLASGLAGRIGHVHDRLEVVGGEEEAIERQIAAGTEGGGDRMRRLASLCAQRDQVVVADAGAGAGGAQRARARHHEINAARSSRIKRWSVGEPRPCSVPSIVALPSADVTMLIST